MRMPRFLRSKRLAGVLRVAAFLAVINVLVTASLLPAARAEVEAKIQERGLALLQQLGPELVGPPETASINGQRMSLASSVTPLAVSEVLDRFERHCWEHSGGLANELAALPGARRALEQLPAEVRDPSRWLSSRQVGRDGNAGQIVCLSPRSSGGGLQGLVSRIVNFLETGDLAALGDARYIVARRESPTSETHVLAIWTDGSFNIPNLFAEHGDSPGSDSAIIPRPRESRRVFSAQLEAHPYALRMYDTRRSQSDVLREYAESLPGQGFRVIPFPRSPEGQDLADNALAFVKGQSALIVLVNTTDEDLTGVTLIEMGGPGFVRATPGVTP